MYYGEELGMDNNDPQRKEAIHRQPSGQERQRDAGAECDLGEYFAPFEEHDNRGDNRYHDDVGVAPVSQRQRHQLMQRAPEEHDRSDPQHATQPVRLR